MNQNEPSTQQPRMQLASRQVLEAALAETLVTVAHPHAHLYRVAFGPDVQPRYHFVDKQRICGCSLGEACPAISAVEQYLQDGGERAKHPRPGYFPTVPYRCPVCAAPVAFAPRLSSRQRGVGWTCLAVGVRHYWQAHTQALRLKITAKALRNLWQTVLDGPRSLEAARLFLNNLA